MSRLSFTSPRSRNAGLVSFAIPENAPWKNAKALFLTPQNSGPAIIAERDPDTNTFSCILPAMGEKGRFFFDVAAADSAAPAPGLACKDAGGKLNLAVGGNPFSTFHYTNRYPKPVWNPILTPKGRNMLREPMDAYGQGEHPWQRGLTLMQGAINGVDCWNEAQKPKFGHTRQDRMNAAHGPLSVIISSENSWYEGEKPLMSDTRFYRFFDTGRDAVVLDIRLTLKATHGDVIIGGTKEAGFLCIRVNPSMNADKAGRMENSYGATDEQGCWSKPAHWVDYVGPIEDETAGFAIFDNPENFRYPTSWHVRGYGLFAPNCWMFKDDVPLKSGSEMTFRWRVIIHTGGTKEARIQERFLDYVDGPRVKWEE